MNAMILLVTFIAQPDVPEVPEVERLKAIKMWREFWQQDYDRWKQDLAEARASNNAAKQREAEVNIKRLTTQPFNTNAKAAIRPDFYASNESQRPGMIGVMPTGYAATVFRIRKDAFPVIDIRYQAGREAGTSSGSDVRTKFVLADQAVKKSKGDSIRFPGLYYVSGTEVIDGSRMAVVVPVEVKPEEMPEPCRPKVKKNN